MQIECIIFCLFYTSLYSVHKINAKRKCHICPLFLSSTNILPHRGLLTVEDSRSHSDTHHSVGILWTSDQPDAETSTWQHATLTRDRHPCPRRDSNPQSQQASGRRPTRRQRGHWDRFCKITRRQLTEFLWLIYTHNYRNLYLLSV